MQLKPVDITSREWAIENIDEPPEVVGRFAAEMFWRGVFAAQKAIPDTHRIVPVELLERVMVFPGSEDEGLLQAIIDKEPT